MRRFFSKYAFWIVTVFVTLASVLAVFLRYTVSWERFFSAFGDLWRAVVSYFCMLFRLDSPVTSTVMELPQIDLTQYLPFDVYQIPRKLKALPQGVFCLRHFVGYLTFLADWFYLFLLYLSLLLPFWMLLKRMLAFFLFRKNNDYAKKSRALIWYQQCVEANGRRLLTWLRRWIGFFCEKRVLLVLFLLLWTVNLNLGTILLELLAFYFSFASAFSLKLFFYLTVKLLIDTVILLSCAPFLFWLCIGVWILHRIRMAIGYRRLEHMERKNRGFLNALPIASLAVGSMGNGKTTMITDMAISQEILFRDKALELMQKNEMRFPYFPWICVELEIKSQVEHGCIYNLATVADWGAALSRQFERYPTSTMLFGYDLSHGLYYQDDLNEYFLLDVILTYAKLYFIYMIESALVVSNYAIRLDFQRDDCGNFPLWRHGLFRWEVGDSPRNTQTSHVIDFDMLRLGKTVVENSPYAGALEFGVVVCAEFGKERKNNLELRETKRTTEQTNQKNDLTDYWLKMCHHGAVVDHYPFLKFFSDEQRPESLGANSRDLFRILHVNGADGTEMALPFYALEGLLFACLHPRYLAFHTQYRFYRGDRTLPQYLIQRLYLPFYHHCIRLENRFGYTVRQVETEDGTLTGESLKQHYYLMSKKIYADRFRTNSFAPIFYRRAKDCQRGLIHRQTYASTEATEAELQMQNSYANEEMYASKGGEHHGI